MQYDFQIEQSACSEKSLFDFKDYFSEHSLKRMKRQQKKNGKKMEPYSGVSIQNQLAVELLLCFCFFFIQQNFSLFQVEPASQFLISLYFPLHHKVPLISPFISVSRLRISSTMYRFFRKLRNSSIISRCEQF